MPVSRRSAAWRVILAGLACGAAVWALSPFATGLREPFDSATLYYPLAIFVAGALASLPAPRHAWLAVPAVFLGERLYALIVYPELRPWMLFGFIINLVIPTWWPAALGALVVYALHRVLGKGRRGDDQRRGA